MLVNVKVGKAMPCHYQKLLDKN